MKIELLFISLILLLFGCGGSSVNEDYVADEMVDALSEDHYVNYIKMDDYSSEELNAGVENLISSLDTVTIDDELFYIAEGDLLIRENELRYYFGFSETSLESNKLVAEIKDGIVVKVANPTNINFSIIKSSFPSQQHYDSIVKFFVGATEDWEQTCNVKFVYENERDDLLSINDNPDDLAFVVKYQRAHTSLLASAFFPYDLKKDKKVLIFPRFFGSPFSQQGIMRHEIGHIIGFRHEHIQSGAPAICRGEETDGTYSLTDYDPKSVMHYFCGGVGSKELLITEKDSIGSNLHYPH